MYVRLNLYFLLISLGIVTSLFLAVQVLLLKNSKRRTNLFFSFSMLIVAYNIFGLGVFISYGWYKSLPWLINTSIPFLFLLGPLVFYYVRKSYDSGLKLSWKEFLKFLPFMIFIIMLMPLYLENPENKIQFMDNWVNSDSDARDFFSGYLVYLLLFIHVTAYLLISLNYIKRQNKSSYGKISAIQIKKQNWLRFYIYSVFAGMVLLVAMMICLDLFSGFNLRNKLIPAGISLVFVCMNFRAMLHPEFFMKRGPRIDRQEAKPPLWIQSGLRKYAEELEFLMKYEELYKKHGLSLGELSEKMNVSRNIVSFVINDHFSMNFYDYVNRYRINDVINSLKQDTSGDINILNIAMDAGFASKTTFNVFFKKYTKMTPSEYREKIRCNI